MTADYWQEDKLEPRVGMVTEVRPDGWIRVSECSPRMGDRIVIVGWTDGRDEEDDG